MNRFWDLLPRAIRFKWKTAVNPTLNRLRCATENSGEFNNDGSLLSPTTTNEPKKQKTTSLTINVPKLFNSEFKQSWEQDPKFCYWPFSLTRTFSVIGWGTVLVFGLQFDKYRWTLKNNTSNKSENSWLECITYALPLDKSSVLDLDQKSSHKSSTEFKPEDYPLKKEEPDADSPLVDKVVGVLDKCVAIGQNIDGITAVNSGDHKAAVEHWKKSSSLGYSKSNFNLGVCYHTGKGVTKDLKKAMKYYQVAADQGHCQAMYNLALLYLNSENNTLNPHFITAMNLLERAAQLGFPQAQTSLGVFYAEEGENYSKAVEMFTAAAEQQDTEALYYLGVCFEAGLGLEQNELKAAEFFMKAANGGHSEAQYCLANYYEQGLGGLAEDKKFAHDLYLKSAKAGHENSQQRLREILQEESENSTPKVLKMLYSIPVLNSFLPLMTNSKLALNASHNNNSHLSTGDAVDNCYQRNNLRDIEEQLDNHLQYMPHCGMKKDALFLPASIPNEVLCS